MCNDKPYNGYKNYESWCVALWIDNDEFLLEEVTQLARDNQYDYRQLENKIKDFVDELSPDVTGMFADLLQSALDNVAWDEIADNFIEIVEQETKEEESATAENED